MASIINNNFLWLYQYQNRMACGKCRNQGCLESRNDGLILYGDY